MRSRCCLVLLVGLIGSVSFSGEISRNSDRDQAALNQAEQQEKARPAEKKRLRVLLLLSDASGILEDQLKVDEKTVTAMLRKQIPASRMTLTVFKGKQATPANVLAHYRQLKTDSSESLLCYVSGNGATDAKHGHFFYFAGKQALLRSDLRKAMVATKAGLAVLISDTCGTKNKLPAKATPRASAKGQRKTGTPKVTARGLEFDIQPLARDLLFKASGIVDINAAAPGQASWGEQAKGGVFTQTFCRLLARGTGEFDTNKDGVVTWAEFYSRLENQTVKDFAAWKKGIEKLGEIVSATSQKPVAFALGVAPKDGQDRPTLPPKGLRKSLLPKQDKGSDAGRTFKVADLDNASIKTTEVLVNNLSLWEIKGAKPSRTIYARNLGPMTLPSDLVNVAASWKNRTKKERTCTLMVAGQDAGGKILWATKLKSTVEGQGVGVLRDSVPLPRGTVKKTATLWVRVVTAEEDLAENQAPLIQSR